MILWKSDILAKIYILNFLFNLYFYSPDNHYLKILLYTFWKPTQKLTKEDEHKYSKTLLNIRFYSILVLR